MDIAIMQFSIQTGKVIRCILLAVNRKEKKLVKYDIISALGGTYANAQLRLLNQVITKIEEGWKPTGGVALAFDSMTKNCYASQAIIKEE